MKKLVIGMVLCMMLSAVGYVGAVGGSIGGSIGSVPGGSIGQLQYNAGGSFGGAAGVTWSSPALTFDAKNLTMTPTYGAEIITAPLASGNWTLGAGWAITAGELIKTAGTGTATPATSMGVTVGKLYKVVIVASAVSTAPTNALTGVYYTIGGTPGRALAAGTNTEYLVARIAENLIVLGNNASTATITSISVKEATAATGLLTVDASPVINGPLTIQRAGLGLQTQAALMLDNITSTSGVADGTQNSPAVRWRTRATTSDNTYDFYIKSGRDSGGGLALVASYSLNGATDSRIWSTDTNGTMRTAAGVIAGTYVSATTYMSAATYAVTNTGAAFGGGETTEKGTVAITSVNDTTVYTTPALTASSVMHVHARCSMMAVAAGDVASIGSFEMAAAFTRDASNATSLVGSVTSVHAQKSGALTANWSMTMSADDTNEKALVTCKDTGWTAGHNVNCKCMVSYFTTTQS